MNSGLSSSGQWAQPVLPVETLLAELPNAVLLSEDPVVYPSNYIIVFGEHAAGAGVPLDEMREREQRAMDHYKHVLEVSAARDQSERSAQEAVREAAEVNLVQPAVGKKTSR